MVLLHYVVVLGLTVSCCSVWLLFFLIVVLGYFILYSSVAVLQYPILVSYQVLTVPYCSVRVLLYPVLVFGYYCSPLLCWGFAVPCCSVVVLLYPVVVLGSYCTLFQCWDLTPPFCSVLVLMYHVLVLGCYCSILQCWGFTYPVVVFCSYYTLLQCWGITVPWCSMRGLTTPCCSVGDLGVLLREKKTWKNQSQIKFVSSFRNNPEFLRRSFCSGAYLLLILDLAYLQLASSSPCFLPLIDGVPISAGGQRSHYSTVLQCRTIVLHYSDVLQGFTIGLYYSTGGQRSWPPPPVLFPASPLFFTFCLSQAPSTPAPSIKQGSAMLFYMTPIQ